MSALAPELRNRLERTIIEARDIAEAGAKAALEGLAVRHYEPYRHQTPEDRKLRNHLRAHARQLGDQKLSKPDKEGRDHGITHLTGECAYEHWHRMLFARFLAENDLLIEPEAGVAISLQECEELAKKAHIDLWTFASRCAQQMLPQIFRPDDPLLQVALAREHRAKLEALLNGIPSEVFKADDALGWVYQFWQSKRKDEVNDSGEKITGDTLPAVTQLFTEHYMVLFLLHNTIGAWYAGKVLAAHPKLAEMAKDEDELRRAVALKAGGGYTFDYLRFVRGSEGKGGPWRPAAGTFDGWPKRAAELKVLDPCCGSGHFLVAVLALLLRLRMEEESLSVAKAADAVLRDNIFGLELDGRCTQIAAFNLALAAWRRGGYRPLPQLHVACSGLAPNTTETDWIALAGKDARLRGGMERLYQLFQKAPILGSLINPRVLGGDMLTAEFDELQPLLEKALERDVADAEEHELAVTAQGIAKAVEILRSSFALVATNVPYLGQRKQDEELKNYCSRIHGDAKSDLATCFVERCLTFAGAQGTAALVTPQNWLFLSSYASLRFNLLQATSFNFVARLGPRAFETIGGEVVNVALLAVSRCHPSADAAFLGLDVSAATSPRDKDSGLRSTAAELVLQVTQHGNPDHRITGHASSDQELLEKHTLSPQGVKTGDDARWKRCFWELSQIPNTWRRYQSPVDGDILYGGREHIIDWRTAGDGMVRPRLENTALGRHGVGISCVGQLAATLYTGELYDSGVATIVPLDLELLPAVWSYCSSAEFREAVRKIDKKVAVTNMTLVRVPFDRAKWQQLASERYPHGLPEPESNDPTQWLFHGRPDKSEDKLHVAVARLLGYRWPAEHDGAIKVSNATRKLIESCDSLLKHRIDNGLLCIPAVRGDAAGADRLATLLHACGVKPERDLDGWLRNDFFEEHCRLFHHRPFLWHVWDGRRDGFHVIVNYHKLAEGDGKGRKLLESLTYSYLGDWIKRQEDGVKREEEGAEDRLSAAHALRSRLEAIIRGEPPFDIFARWKTLSQQPLGWEPDVSDGIRVNIRPFLADDLPNGRAGAGVLRSVPNIKWEKDRGKEQFRSKADFPWFWGWDEETDDFIGGKDFTGERFNACHYSPAVKSQARDAAKLQGSRR